MTREPHKPDESNDREARLKAALRANLARRKAQGRARAAGGDPSEDEQQHGPKTPRQGAPGNED